MRDYVTKHRLLHEDHWTVTSSMTNNGVLQSTPSTSQKDFRAFEVVRTRGNVKSPRELNGSTEDRGGEFDLVRYNHTYSSTAPDPLTYDFMSLQWKTTGPMWPTHFPSSFGPAEGVIPPFRGIGDLAAMGTKAIALVSPTNPRAGLSQALVELKRDGLPTAMSSFANKRTMKGGASDYLNYQFGWLPLISDVRSIATSVLNAEKLLTGLRDHANKPLRRRFNFPTKESVFAPSVTAYVGGHSSTARQIGAVLIQTTTENVWFSGAIQYGYPISDDAISRLRAAAIDARYLLGLDFSPETIWNVLPWSWLADWFFNVGDVMRNVSNFAYNQQVLKYGYVMRQRTVHSYYDYYGLYRGQKVSAELQTWEISKTRIKATPYGFGLTWAGFSPYQLSILAALGLSNRRG